MIEPIELEVRAKSPNQGERCFTPSCGNLSTHEVTSARAVYFHSVYCCEKPECLVAAANRVLQVVLMHRVVSEPVTA